MLAIAPCAELMRHAIYASLQSRCGLTPEFRCACDDGPTGPRAPYSSNACVTSCCAVRGIGRPFGPRLRQHGASCDRKNAFCPDGDDMEDSRCFWSHLRRRLHAGTLLRFLPEKQHVPGHQRHVSGLQQHVRTHHSCVHTPPPPDPTAPPARVALMPGCC